MDPIKCKSASEQLATANKRDRCAVVFPATTEMNQILGRGFCSSTVNFPVQRNMLVPTVRLASYYILRSPLADPLNDMLKIIDVEAVV